MIQIENILCAVRSLCAGTFFCLFFERSLGAFSFWFSLRVFQLFSHCRTLLLYLVKIFKMFYDWEDFSTFIYFSPFEVFLFLVTVTGTTFLLTVKLITESSFHLLTWWTVLSPLFIFDITSALFCMIVFIRQLQTGKIKKAVARAFFSFLRIATLFTTKVMVINKMNGLIYLTYSEITMPIMFLNFILCYRALLLREIPD